MVCTGRIHGTAVALPGTSGRQLARQGSKGAGSCQPGLGGGSSLESVPHLPPRLFHADW